MDVPRDGLLSVTPMKPLFLLLLLLLSIVPAEARRRWIPTTGPHVIDGQVAAAVGPTSGTTITQSANCTGANVLYVYSYGLAAGAWSNSTATFNGVSMTRIAHNDPAAGVAYQDCFRLVAPASGAHNVVVTYTGSTLTLSAIVCVPAYGVNVVTPDGTIPTPTSNLGGASTTATITSSSAAGELVLSFVLTNQTITNGAGETTVASLFDPVGNSYYKICRQPGAASVVSSYTFAASLWLELANPVKP